MKKYVSRILAFLLAVLIVAGLVAPVVHATGEVVDEEVQAVIDQLEAIDTLQQMQAKRYTYTVKKNYYDTGTTDPAIAEEHNAARAGYETYVSEMFAARIAAQQAYDALTEEQKAQIDPDLVAKLSNDLPTVFRGGTFAVTPSDNEYTFEAVNGGAGYAYEVGNHMVSGQITQTFILVDTSNGETSWTPSGKYVYGESNYLVAYCCDVETGLEYTTDYKRLNLEDSNYYGTSASQHIRAILQNSYPYVTIAEMKASLKAGGMDPTFVDNLTRADIISAVQMAIWTYANAADGAAGGLGYFASVDVTKNTGKYFTPLHDYTNECWDWLPGKGQRSYDARAAYRVNNLAYYLCNLEGVAPEDDQIVISDVEVTRAELIQGTSDTYQVGMYVYLNHNVSEEDDLKITVTSYHTDDDGTVVTTARMSQLVGGRSAMEVTIKANNGDTIKVVVEGTQKLARGVYFYEPEGGRDASQCLVGVGEGETAVRVEKTFEFVEEIDDMGLRIYKTEAGTGAPLSDIIFRVYNAVPGAGESLSDKPDAEEVAKYATAENLVGTMVTDVTGYAAIALEEGTYLVVEEDSDQVKAPVDPFYIAIPMAITNTSEGGTTTTSTVGIISVYPKNEPEIPPEEPPIVPPTPDNVSGKFEILKHDELDREMVLEGAQFEVYRAATQADEETVIIDCKGVKYAVVPVMVNGGKLVLTTDENGKAVSPELECGTYFLVETKAPAGYNLPAEAISVTVISNEMTSHTVVEISNQRGNVLPETGGVGTTWFLVIGSVMAVGAAVLLITKRRMSFCE